MGYGRPAPCYQLTGQMWNCQRYIAVSDVLLSDSRIQPQTGNCFWWDRLNTSALSEVQPNVIRLELSARYAVQPSESVSSQE